MDDAYDLIIIGAGPAGLAAAIYGGRARLKTLVVNKGQIGGMPNTTREIVNYPGYLEISGSDLMLDFKKHAEHFGVEFLRAEITRVDFSAQRKEIHTKKGRTLTAKAVIVACGSEPRLLNIPGEKRLKGNGVAYCATCDAEFFSGEDVVIVGSGDQAIEEGLYITRFARKVTVLVLHGEGILDCNKVSAARAFKNEKMEFIWNTTIAEVLGEESVTGVKIKNLQSGAVSELSCQGVFFFVGMIPSTQFLKESGVQMDAKGYIPVNEKMETNLEGVYAAGDNRVKYLRQVVAAAGDGATAAVAAERYIDELDAFNSEVLGSDQPVLLTFFHAQNNRSLEFCTVLDRANQEGASRYKIVKVDMATRQNLARQYRVTEAPAVVVLERGREIKRLECCLEQEKLAGQLS